MPGSGASNRSWPPQPADLTLRARAADARTPSSASGCAVGNSAATAASRARRNARQRKPRRRSNFDVSGPFHAVSIDESPGKPKTSSRPEMARPFFALSRWCTVIRAQKLVTGGALLVQYQRETIVFRLTHELHQDCWAVALPIANIIALLDAASPGRSRRPAESLDGQAVKVPDERAPTQTHDFFSHWSHYKMAVRAGGNSAGAPPGAPPASKTACLHGTRAGGRMRV